MTPHAAYYSEEAMAAVRRIAADEAVRILTGQPARYPVNDLAAAGPGLQGANGRPDQS